MSKRVFIDGAAGTTGIEIADRLVGRAEFEVVRLDEDRRKDAGARREELNAADFVILCLPDDAAREAVSMIENDRVRVIDASSAHRTARLWTYGFPELTGKTEVARARFVSNPGCYPTGFLALVAPLVRAGILPADWPYICHAVSGYSGGGKGLIERFEQGDGGEIAWRGYGLAMGHKHLPEMKAHAGLAREPLFCPAVVGAFRGMVVEVPLPLSAMDGAGEPELFRAALSDHYAGSELVIVEQETPGELLIERNAAPWDGMRLYVFASPDRSQARLVAMLDNLGKGASGAAVQNLNLMAGLPETEGLRLPGAAAAQ